MRTRLAIAVFVMIVVARPFQGRVGGAESPAPLQDDKEKRLEWFREAKYGLFVHWGLATVVVVEFDGQNVERTK
jgi:alpha-L-fucosidase-like protein